MPDSLPTVCIDVPSVGMVLQAVMVTISSWVLAVLVNVLTALLVDFLGRSMSWFTHTLLIVPLYTIPALLAMAEVHSFWLKQVMIYMNYRVYVCV